MNKGSGTASSLLWQVERILNECAELNCLPDVLLMENVKQVHGKKNIDNWNIWLKTLEELGYHNHYADLNSKNFGVAQNRERCYMISLLSDLPYEFPEPIPLEKRLKDYLEKDVDEKYYINNEKANKLISELLEKGVIGDKEPIDLSVKELGTKEIANCLNAAYRGIKNRRNEDNGVIEAV